MKRQRVIASIEQGNAKDIDLDSCLSSLFLSNCPYDLDCIVEVQVLCVKVVRRADALNKSGAISKDDESGASENAQAKHPSANERFPAHALLKITDENSMRGCH